MIQHMLADSAMEINACRLALWQTASRIDAGEEARGAISMLKVQASEMLGRVVDRAVQIYGGLDIAVICRLSVITEMRASRGYMTELQKFTVWLWRDR